MAERPLEKEVKHSDSLLKKNQFLFYYAFKTKTKIKVLGVIIAIFPQQAQLISWSKTVLETPSHGDSQQEYPNRFVRWKYEKEKLSFKFNLELSFVVNKAAKPLHTDWVNHEPNYLGTYYYFSFFITTSHGQTCRPRFLYFSF